MEFEEADLFDKAVDNPDSPTDLLDKNKEFTEESSD